MTFIRIKTDQLIFTTVYLCPVQIKKPQDIMTQLETLVVLVNSMTKSEKKSFMTYTSHSESNKAYLVLFELINKSQISESGELKKRFQKDCPDCSFNTAVKYLYRVLLNILVSLRQTQDSYFILFNRLLTARVLYEKSLFDEALKMVRKTISEAKIMENHSLLLIAQNMELELLRENNFKNMSEKTLLNKQFQVGQSLNTVRKINEQTFLYELLKHRMLYKGNTRTARQKKDLDDLVFSEMSIVASSRSETFEIRKMHQLFQANYMIATGDYVSALHSFYELNNIFEKNEHSWANPPIYYLSVIEGILESLHIIRNYRGMQYFVEKLKNINSFSVSFQANVMCLIFLYEMFPYLDSGDLAAADRLMSDNSALLEKRNLLSLTRQTELSFYMALINLGNQKIVVAKKIINQIVFKEKMFYHLPLYRPIRLLNLMLYYELKDFDIIDSEIRSIKRDIADNKKSYKTERIIMSIIKKQSLPLSDRKRKSLWNKIRPELEALKQDKFERQILKLFDFTAWVESKICDIPLEEVLKRNTDNQK